MASVPIETSSALALPPQIARAVFNQRSFSALAALAAALALLAALWMWGRAPDYRVLYTNLSNRDAGAVVNALQQMNVPYKLSSDGDVMVPAGRLYQIRLHLAGEGLPKGDSVGFEVLDHEKFGTSEFVEHVNYQRALEGELARSVQSLNAVRSARVHLAIPKPSVFVRSQTQPSASVLVDLYPGRTLDASKVNAIAHLVASSVAGLTARKVTVVDQNGDLLTPTGAQPSGLDAYQLRYLRDVERDYAQRIEDIVGPIVGPGNVHAQVTADLDFSQTEDVSETYKPNQRSQADAAVLSKQTRASSEPASAEAGGIPGALSNVPPGASSAPLNAPPAAIAAAKSAAKKGKKRTTAHSPAMSTHQESTVNYDVDKTVRHTRDPVGSIKRLSVAVVINDRSVTDANGKTRPKPLPTQEMAQITSLVKEVMGYNKQRGDSLNVVNAAFTTVALPPLSQPPFWKRPGVLATAAWLGKNLLIAIVVLIVALRIVAPLVRSLANFASVSPAAAPEIANAVPAPATLPTPGYQDNLQMVKQLARQEPKLVASVVQNWVSGDEG